MNNYSGYPLARGFGWWAMIRLAKDGKPRPVMEKGDKPKVFNSPGEAWEEIAKHLLAFMNGHEIRGERFDGCNSYRSEVDRLYFSGSNEVAA